LGPSILKRGLKRVRLSQFNQPRARIRECFRNLFINSKNFMWQRSVGCYQGQAAPTHVFSLVSTGRKSSMIAVLARAAGQLGPRQVQQLFELAVVGLGQPSQRQERIDPA
jgi:hypothetical protein